MPWSHHRWRKGSSSHLKSQSHEPILIQFNTLSTFPPTVVLRTAFNLLTSLTSTTSPCPSWVHASLNVMLKWLRCLLYIQKNLDLNLDHDTGILNDVLHPVPLYIHTYVVTYKRGTCCFLPLPLPINKFWCCITYTIEWVSLNNPKTLTIAITYVGATPSQCLWNDSAE